MKSERRKGYSTLDVAQMLGVTAQTVQRWVDAGHLSCWRTVGGHRRIDAESVQRFKEVSGVTELAALIPETVQALSERPLVAGVPIVLIVDDDPADREMVAYLVHRQRPEWHIEFAENGFSALLSIGRNPPRVLITDVAMPYMNGSAMLKTLFASAEHRDMAVLAVSSHSSQEITEMGGLPPGVAFLHKPISRNALGRFLDGIDTAVSTSG